jgi:hypothetical protein
MPQFTVDEDVARLVEKLAEPKPFEHLTFNNALKRVLEKIIKLLENQSKPTEGFEDLDKLLEESMALQRKQRKKAPSPSAIKWVEAVPELKDKGLGNWKAICGFLQIDTGGDSGRRRLQVWVKENRPGWPDVPDVED